MDMRLSLNQIAKLISASGADKSYLIEGPMGSGKSSIINLLREMHGGKYDYVTIDCTQWDVGDVQVPDVDKVNRVIEFLPNVLLIGDGQSPMCVLLDEFGKASRPVQNAMLPVLLERRVGARAMPAGSIVFIATNLGGEGVGDLTQPHARNRISVVENRGPSNEEWMLWGMEHDVPAPVLAWARETPQLFQSFKDVADPRDNPYIFHPKEQRRSFVTPRSLYLASIELRDDVRAAVGDWDATLAAIAGNIGARGAMDLMAFVQLADKMPAWKLVVAEPTMAAMPTDTAMVLMVFKAVSQVTEETLPAVMTYVKRMPKEMQCMFAQNLLRIRSKSAFAALNRDFTTWVAENHWIMK